MLFFTIFPGIGFAFENLFRPKIKSFYLVFYVFSAFLWQKGTKAPQAAGKIHTDFEKGFIMAEVMKFDDFKELGSEAAVKVKIFFYYCISLSVRWNLYSCWLWACSLLFSRTFQWRSYWRSPSPFIRPMKTGGGGEESPFLTPLSLRRRKGSSAPLSSRTSPCLGLFSIVALVFVVCNPC